MFYDKGNSFRLPLPSAAWKSSITPPTPFSHRMVAESPVTSLEGRSFGLKLTIPHLRSLITTSSTTHHNSRIATLYLNSFLWLIAISSSMTVFETRHRSFHRESRYPHATFGDLSLATAPPGPPVLCRSTMIHARQHDHDTGTGIS